MRNSSLLWVTVVTVLFTAVALKSAGWFSGQRPHRTVARHVEVRTAAEVNEILTTEAAWRNVHGQASHWRSYVMQQR
jgi:hypothetical protein